MYAALIFSALFMLPDAQAANMPAELGGKCLDMYHDSWEMVEEIIFKEAEKNTPAGWGRIAAAATGSLVTGLIGAYFAGNVYDRGLRAAEDNNIISYSTFLAINDSTSLGTIKLRKAGKDGSGAKKLRLNLGALLGAVGLGWFTAKNIMSFGRGSKLRDTQRWQMDCIVKQWETDAFKNAFPQELHGIFNELKSYANAPEYANFRDKALDHIKAKIAAHKAQLKQTKYTFPEVEEICSLKN